MRTGAAAIDAAQGRLGMIIDALRDPIAGIEKPVQPTLAKYLFLRNPGNNGYMAIWGPAERARARAAYAQKTLG